MRVRKPLSALVVLVLMTTMVVAVPMSAQAVTVDEPDDIPGVDPGQATYQSTVGGAGDPADVFRVDVDAYDTLFVGVSAAASTDFDVYLFDPTASEIASPPIDDTTALAGYPRGISYCVPVGQGGTYSVAVRANGGSGPYMVTMWVMSPERCSQETTENYSPRVDGDIVTWWDWDSNSSSQTVLVHDLDTSVTTTLGPGASGGYVYPDVSDGVVVINDNTGGERVVEYDVDTATEATLWASPGPTNTVNRPRIDEGTAVWEWFSTSGPQYGGIYYKKRGATPGTWGYGNAVAESQPVVSGDKIAYVAPWHVGAGASEYNLDVFDISEGASVTIASTIRGNYLPALDFGGDIVAWMDHQASGLNNEDILAYDFSSASTFVVCDDSGMQRYPAVSDCWIVWEDDVAFYPDTSIRGYHVSSGIIYDLRDFAGVNESLPDVGSGTLAWQDDRMGDALFESQDIYAGYLPPDDTGPTTLMATTEQPGETRVKLEAFDDPFGCGVSYTQYKIDDGAWSTYAGPFWLDQAGTHDIVYKSKDNAGHYGPYVYGTVTVNAAASVDYTAVSGADRYATAVQISKESYPNGAGTVVVATAANWPDALGGAALAGAVNGPIMLVEQGSVPDVVADEIGRLGATRAIILGGTAVVGDSVRTALQGKGLTVTRIGGANRFETAELIAEATIDLLGGGYDGTAFAATGGNFPDALAAAPIAASQGWPIFLMNPDGSTPAAMAALGVDDAFILGGTAVVSTAQQTALDAALAGDVERLAGDDRYSTAVVVARYGIDNAGLFWDGVTLATGENFPDALSGGVLAATNGSVMVLTRTHSLPDVVETALSENKTEIDDVFYLGGTSAISQTVRNQVADALE